MGKMLQKQQGTECLRFEEHIMIMLLCLRIRTEILRSPLRHEVILDTSPYASSHS